MSCSNADNQALATRAKELRSSGDYENAISSFNQVIQLCKKCNSDYLAKLYNERGFTKYLYVDFDGAVEDYTKAIELNKSSPIFYYNRALVHYRLARFRLAVDDADIALQLKPDFQDAAQCRQQAIIDGKLTI